MNTPVEINAEMEIPRISGEVAILADLHLDHYRQHGVDWFARHRLSELAWETLDALIIAGDLVNNPTDQLADALRQVARHIDPGKIVFVAGNHDYYFHAIDADAELAEIVEGEGARFAQKTVLRHGADRFLCATLWRDFAIHGDVAAGMRAARAVHNDYNFIVARGTDPDWLPELEDRSAFPGMFTPQIAAAVHHDHRAWLERELTKPFSGRTVVVTHHCPHPEAAGPLFSYSTAYVSNLGDLISRTQPDGWFFGHTHHRTRKRIGATDLRNVSLGYPRDPHSGAMPGVLDLCRWR